MTSSFLNYFYRDSFLSTNPIPRYVSSSVVNMSVINPRLIQVFLRISSGYVYTMNVYTRNYYSQRNNNVNVFIYVALIIQVPQ
jgi:hypothetical protein